MSSRPAFVLLVLVLLGAVAHSAWYYPRLPDRVACHFDWQGRPDGWSSRGALFTHLGITVGALLVVIAAASFLIERLPASLVNLPNRRYWLHPDRKRETCAYLRGWMLRFTAAVVLFMAGVMHLTFRVNLGRDAALHPAMWGLVAGLLVYVAAVTVMLVVRFRRVPPGGDAGPAP